MGVSSIIRRLPSKNSEYSAISPTQKQPLADEVSGTFQIHDDIITEEEISGTFVPLNNKAQSSLGADVLKSFEPESWELEILDLQNGVPNRENQAFRKYVHPRKPLEGIFASSATDDKPLNEKQAQDELYDALIGAYKFPAIARRHQQFILNQLIKGQDPDYLAETLLNIKDKSPEQQERVKHAITSVDKATKAELEEMRGYVAGLDSMGRNR